MKEKMFDTDQTVKDVKGAPKIKQDGQPIKVNVSQPASKQNTLVPTKKAMKTSDDEYEDDQYNDFEQEEGGLEDSMVDDADQEVGGATMKG